MADRQAPIAHIGWDVSRLARLWARRYASLMVAEGYPWATEARAALLAHMSRDGTQQSDLARRSGLTKQAVQQHIDGLIADGLIERIDTPGDKRRRQVIFTPEGHQAIATGDRIKRQIEAEFAAIIGAEALAQIQRHLAALSAALEAQGYSSS